MSIDSRSRSRAGFCRGAGLDHTCQGRIPWTKQVDLNPGTLAQTSRAVSPSKKRQIWNSFVQLRDPQHKKSWGTRNLLVSFLWQLVMQTVHSATSLADATSVNKDSTCQTFQVHVIVSEELPHVYFVFGSFSTLIFLFLLSNGNLFGSNTQWKVESAFLFSVWCGQLWKL